MKKYVYSYLHEGKKFYWSNCDVEGDILVSDIEDASIFSEKKVNSLGLDDCFSVGDQMYCEEVGDYIEFLTKPEKEEV